MRRARLIGTVMVSVLVLAGCGSLTPVTEQGRDIHWLYNILFVVAAVIFVLVEAAIVFAVVRYRRRSDMLPPQFHGNNLLEVVWTVGSRTTVPHAPPRTTASTAIAQNSRAR